MEGQSREGEQDPNHDMECGTMADSETLEDLGCEAGADCGIHGYRQAENSRMASLAMKGQTVSSQVKSPLFI